MRLKDCRVAFRTLGCKLNFSETSAIRHSLEACGAVAVSRERDASLIVVNTCSVTDVAERKARQLIRHLHAVNPSAAIVVVGCYAQLQGEELLKMEGVVLVVGSAEKMHLAERLLELEVSDGSACSEGSVVAGGSVAGGSQGSLGAEKRLFGGDVFEVKRFDAAFSYGDRTRSFLKIQDGCNYFCSYCTIPFARGVSRSSTIAEVVECVREIARHGVKEVILTGVNTGEFGREHGESLLELLEVLEKENGVERFRISSIEPNLLSEEIISFLGSSKRFMPHFHIPLQSGSDEVLRLMRRRYDSALFAERIATIRQIVPDAFIGVDVIAGMRGESEELFEESFDFISGLDFSALHVFPYSERSGTKALEIPSVVSQREKHERVAKLMELSRMKHEAFIRRFIGTTRPVLFEGRRVNGRVEGFTDNYIRLSAPWDETLVNSICSVELSERNLPELEHDAPELGHGSLEFERDAQEPGGNALE